MSHLNQTGLTKKPGGYSAGLKPLVALCAAFQPMGPFFAGTIFQQHFIAAAVAYEFAATPDFVNSRVQFLLADHKD